MAFWKLGFGTQSSIDTLLGGSTNCSSSPSFIALDALDPGSASSGSAHGFHHGSSAPPPVSLERLLDEDDLLSECKNGHGKLVSR